MCECDSGSIMLCFAASESVALKKSKWNIEEGVDNIWALLVTQVIARKLTNIVKLQ